MTVTLNIEELFKDIRLKSRLECSAIADTEARYRVEAGTEKNDELYRDMTAAQGSLARRLARYLSASYVQEGDNTLFLPEAFVYELTVTDRRLQGKVQPLADACHDFIVHYTLSRFYKSVGMGDMSNAHSLQAAETGEEIDMLLYTKAAPTA